MPTKLREYDMAQGTSLSELIEFYRQEAVRLVANGFEHPRFEAKREAYITRDRKPGRVEFIKTIQALANAHVDEERMLVVGADMREKRFYPLPNSSEFDAAQVGAVLTANLEPSPLFSVFQLRTEQDEPFVVIILSAEQPRPVCCKCDMADSDGKILLRKGEVWIKENTATRLATRDDFERMVRLRVETEAEIRAKARFAQFLADRDASLPLLSPTASTPKSDLLFGPEARFQDFVEDVIATEDESRFRMLLELMRDQLVEGWHVVGAFRPGGSTSELTERYENHMRNVFGPTINRLATTGLLICKLEAMPSWFQRVADLLCECHTTATKLTGLEYSSQAMQRRVAIESARKARIVAAYALKRERYQYSAMLLWKLSRTKRNGARVPLLFDWFERNNTADIPNAGLAGEVWLEAASWITKFFGTADDLNDAIAALEFILEFNSFLQQGAENAKAPLGEWFEQHYKDLYLIYFSAIWRLDLSAAEPIAIYLAEALKHKNTTVLQRFSVEPNALTQLVSRYSVSDPLEPFRAFLTYLRSTQQAYFFQAGRFRRFDWSERVKLAAGFAIGANS